MTIDDTTPSPRGLKRSLSTPDKPDEVATVEKRQRHVSIVLTGGPCAGKSSVLAVIRDRLRKRGMQVITVPEYATHFFENSDGFQLEWAGTEKENGMQDVFLRYQMMQEDMFADFGALNSKPCVLLLDRSVMDQKVFTSDEIWEATLRKNKVTEKELLNRYDMIMHLGTCAKKGDYEWGPGSNNPGRFHNPEEAAKLDKKLEEVYYGSKQLRMVPHFEKFKDKIDTVMKYLEDALGVDGLAGARDRISVHVKPGAIPAEVTSQGQSFMITSTFLDESMELSVQRRLRVSVDSWLAGLAGDVPKPNELPISSSHVDQTFEERRQVPGQKMLTRRVISEAQYHNEVRIARHTSVVKYVMTFQSESGHHYELFYFQKGGSPDMVLDFTKGSQMPSWLSTGGDMSAQARPHGRPARKLARHSTAEAAETMRTRAIA